MLSFDLNWVAVLAAVVLAQVLGFLWYGNVLFGKAWAAAQGKTMEEIGEEGGSMGYIYALIAAAVSIIVLANVLMWANVSDLTGALMTAFIVWLGFIATTMALNTAFEMRGWTLWMINAGYQVVNLLIAATVLTMMA